MNNKISYILFVLTIAVVLFFSCNNEPKIQKTDSEMSQLQEPLVKVNKFLVEKDEVIISKYAKRRNWEMTETETGLWYMVYESGLGDSIGDGDIITVKYELSLLDGTICYNTDTLGAESFVVGGSVVESGLDEGVTYLRQGDKARIILPPHLAHGLLGDENKIPARSIIIFDIEIFSVKKYKGSL